MKTVSINVMNLCVPCENRCRYCLLSYDGKVSGVAYARSETYAKRFYEWLKVNRPDLSFLFSTSGIISTSARSLNFWV